MGIRYNDESYLAAWRDEGKFPRIHDNIFTLFMQTFEADSVIDMCCATGLLGTRISEKTGIDVVGVELLEKNIVRAKKFGVEMEFFQMFIERRTLPAFVNLIKERKATGIVARRCIRELFGNTPDQTVDWKWSRIWSAAVAEAGIKEILIEGRAD